MRAKEDGLRAEEAGVVDPGEVPHLLFSPRPDHLARVAFTVAAAEPELARDVLVPVFEHQDRRLVDLDGSGLVVGRRAVVHVCLFA